MHQDNKFVILALSLSVLTLASMSALLSISHGGVLGVATTEPAIAPTAVKQGAFNTEVYYTAPTSSPKIVNSVPCASITELNQLYCKQSTTATAAICNRLSSLTNSYCQTPTPSPVSSTKCNTNGDCATGQTCYQPPMPACPTGTVCAQSMPAKYCKVDTCQNLWWSDSTHKTCAQRQFCGAYMYAGLNTFSTQAACNSALKTTPVTSETHCKTDADCNAAGVVGIRSRTCQIVSSSIGGVCVTNTNVYY